MRGAEHPGDTDEVRLVELARGGDGPAFAELVRRHQSRVRVLLAFHGVDRARLDDLVQDVFLLAFRRLGAYRGDAPFGAWLVSIARRRLLEAIRNETRLAGRHRRAIADALASDRLVLLEDGGDEPFVSERTLEALRACVQALPATSATLVEQHYFHARSVVSIAAELGRNESSLRTTLMRIRQALRACVRRRLAEEG